MRKIAIAAALLSLGSAPVLADMTEGKAAYEAGDYSTAITELKPLAIAGDAAAQALLAQIYLGGHGGSATEAMALLGAAANQGDSAAQSELGLIYATGKGAPADNVKAYQWFALAAQSAKDERMRILAETNRDAVARRLIPTERATANALVDAWQPSMSQIFASAGTATAPTPAVAAISAVTPDDLATAADAPPAGEPTQIASATPDVAIPDAAASAAEITADITAETVAGIRIQLASVPYPEQAPGEWKRLQHKYAAALGDLSLTVEAADLGTKGVYHRLQAGPFTDKASAEARCAELKAAGAACLVVVR